MTSEPVVLSSEHQFMGLPRMCFNCNASPDTPEGREACPESSAVKFASHELDPLESKCKLCGIPRNNFHTKHCKDLLLTGEGSTLIRSELAQAKLTQLVVTHNNENVTYHPVGPDRPWRIDAGKQELVIGKGVGRVMVPLCNIMYYTLEEY